MRWPVALLHKIRRVAWWLFRPKTIGVRAIVLDTLSRILLVQHSYEKGWYLPGGRVRRGEDLRLAIKRELAEELGVAHFELESILGTYSNHYEYKRDTITVFIVRISGIKSRKHFEIAKVAFFDARQLPAGMSPGTKRRIEEYLHKKSIRPEW